MGSERSQTTAISAVIFTILGVLTLLNVGKLF